MTKLDDIRGLYTALERAGESGNFRFRDVEEMADVLRRAGSALTRIHTSKCNGIERPARNTDGSLIRVGNRITGRLVMKSSWTDADQVKADKAIARHLGRARAVVDRLNAESMLGGWQIRFNSDPRGAAIQLYAPGENAESGNAAAYF